MWKYINLSVYLIPLNPGRKKDRYIDRKTDRYIDRKKDRYIDKKTDRYIHIDRKTDRYIIKINRLYLFSRNINILPCQCDPRLYSQRETFIITLNIK